MLFLLASEFIAMFLLQRIVVRGCRGGDSLVTVRLVGMLAWEGLGGAWIYPGNIARTAIGELGTCAAIDV